MLAAKLWNNQDTFFETYVFQRPKNDGAKKCGNYYFGSYILPKFVILGGEHAYKLCDITVKPIASSFAQTVSQLISTTH